MDKIIEALSKLVKPEDMKEVSSVVESMIEQVKADLEKEYEAKIQDAYAELSNEVKTAEATAETGYQEAYTIIADLRNRLESQRSEFEAALEEGYEEAFQMLQQEKGSKDAVETDLYAEYDKKLSEMKEYMIDKVDAFLQYKGKEIYEQARRDVINDPRLAERAVTLNKVVETVSEYLADEDIALATSSKLQEAQKTLEETKGQIRLLEARNIRIASQNTKLEEQVRQSAELIKENTVVTAKNRKESAKNVEGRGKSFTGKTEVIAEDVTVPVKEDNKVVNTSLFESLKPSEWTAMASLAGIKKD
jgi:hypothetical protein